MIEKKPAKSTLLALTLVAVIALSAFLLHAQTSPNDQATQQTEAQFESQAAHGSWRELQAQRVEGSWIIVVTPAVLPGVPQPPSFNVYGTFTRGGAYLGSDRNSPFGSPQHGVWAHLGGNRFANTFKQDLFDGVGNFTGILTVRARITLTGRDEFVGVANGEQRDAIGDLVFNRCSTIRGTRIQIEPLASQCQSITPPR